MDNKIMSTYDICIIGGGVIGCAIARELAKYDLKICLIEKSEDVACGTTKANSGIVHGGYNEKHGSIKAKFSASGNRLFQQLDNELHFGFAQTGSLLIGFNDNDNDEIYKIYENGKKNGVHDLQIVNSDFIRSKEPHLNRTIRTALYCKHSGITSPYELAIALTENAITNGVELRLACEVIAIKKEDKENGEFTLTTKVNDALEPTYIKSKCVINAAGLYADDIAKMIGINDFTITPRQGQYLLFDKDQGHLANSVIFQVPTAVSKGVLVTRTFHGNLLIGPDATTVEHKEYLDTHDKNIQHIVQAAQQSVPDFDLRKVITSFAGNRAASSTGDFIVEENKQVKCFINVAGIESPGLTAAPAIAVYMVELAAEAMHTKFQRKTNFNPERPTYKAVASMDERELQELIKKDPSYGRIVCRCETVSEGEILDALRRPIPINSLDAIKRRTRAGMGRCQAGFCTPRIMEIIQNELHLPLEKITKKGRDSLMVIGRTKRALVANTKAKEKK
jgi:glycerol-3-phosphate dehydrogenase